MLLAGCSWVPDYANPVEWYKGAASWFENGEETETAASGETEPSEAEQPEPAPGADKPYPELSSVPPKPEPSSPAEREKAMQGLVGDREQARHTTESKAPPPPAQPAPATEGTAPPPQTTGGEAAQAPSPPSAPAQDRAPSTAEETAPPRMAATVPPVPTSPPSPATAGGSSFQEIFQQRVQQQEATTTTLPAWAKREPFEEPDRQPQAGPAPEAGGADGEGASAAPGDQTLGYSGGAVTLPQFRQPRSGVSVQVGTVHFGRGSADLDSRDRATLRKVVDMYKERPGSRIRVVGHASHWTRDMAPASHQIVNFDVSVMRAEAVGKELVDMGVAPDDLIIGAKSDNEPIYYEVMPSGEAGNRRAEIFLEY